MDGILVVDKPVGPTSHDIVALVRRLSATRRIGHGGTLDPFAGGVLPLFLGRATRLAEYHLGRPKAYRATVCFGASSSTDDLDGERTPVPGPPVAREALEAALERFRGRIEQVPPDYSAVQVEGRRAYAIARSGETPALAARTVTIERLDLVEWDAADPERPIAVLDVACSAGTYVRALARDLGAALGSGAYLGALTRTASGGFTAADALQLADVRAAAADGPDGLLPLLRPIDTGLEDWPLVVLTDAEVEDVVRGRFVRPADPAARPVEGPVRLRDGRGRLVALAAWHGPRIAPTKVLVDVPAPPPVQALEAPAAAPETPAPAPDPAPLAEDPVDA
jgi:tRNA pseudouridine55 synthase